MTFLDSPDEFFSFHGRVERYGEAAPNGAGSGGSPEDSTHEETPRLRPTPFRFTDPRAIPPRSWLYAKHYVRGTVSATVGTGGSAKTTNALVEAVAMTSGRKLLDAPVNQPRRVWVINLEESAEELQRRIAA